jgi:hypothetical protein
MVLLISFAGYRYKFTESRSGSIKVFVNYVVPKKNAIEKVFEYF